MSHRIKTTTPAPTPAPREPASVNLYGFPRVGDVLPCPRWPLVTASMPAPELCRVRWVWVLRR